MYDIFGGEIMFSAVQQAALSSMTVKELELI